jgi:threonyl-tRNA synthetase
LLEHTAGKLPLWISPEQVRVIPVAEAHHSYAAEVRGKLAAADLRVTIDARNETLGKRVRAAQLEKVNYILVVGEQEAGAGTVNVRTRDNQVHGASPLAEFTQRLREEIRSRALDA